MIVFSSALVLARLNSVHANNPIFLWKNLIDAIVADHENENYPASNLLTTSTAEVWKSDSTATQYLTMTVNAEGPVNALAIARHNLGTGGCVTSIEYQTQASPEAWTEICEERLLADDAAAIFLFEDTILDLTKIRFKLQPDEIPPQIGVVYAGKYLQMPAGIPAGHTALADSKDSQVVTGMSEGGEFLGRILVREVLGTAVQFEFLEGEWYREHMRPFVDGAVIDPFFFAWAPEELPNEVGYCWLSKNARPTIYNVADLFQVTLDIGGIA